jgi:hypothetical protein
MKPPAIRQFEAFYLLNIVFGIAGNILNNRAVAAQFVALHRIPPDAVQLRQSMGYTLAGAAISLVLWFFIGRRSNVARWIATILAGLAGLNVFLTMAITPNVNGLAVRYPPGGKMLMMLTVICSLIAVSRLFSAEGKAWFAKVPAYPPRYPAHPPPHQPMPGYGQPLPPGYGPPPPPQPPYPPR